MARSPRALLPRPFGLPGRDRRGRGLRKALRSPHGLYYFAGLSRRENSPNFRSHPSYKLRTDTRASQDGKQSTFLTLPAPKSQQRCPRRGLRLPSPAGSRLGAQAARDPGRPRTPCRLPELQIPGCLSDSRSLPLSLPPPPIPSPPALVVLAGSPRAEFQRKSGQKPEPARTWEGEEEREEEGAGSGRDRGSGPGGSEPATGPGWGRRRRRSARGRDSRIHPRSRGAQRLVPPGSPPSSAAASVNPPSGETCSVPSACRPAPPCAWPPTRDLPCARCPPTLAAFPGVRGAAPPSPDEGQGGDCPGRTGTESGQAGVDAARGIVCVCE